MRIVQAPRASAILYNFLKSQVNTNPWLLPANICPVVPLTFFKAKIPIEFADISAETLHIDLEQVEGRMKQNMYGGLLYPHTYGEPSTPADFFQRVKSQYPELLIVDDRCLCIPDLDPPQDMFADAVLYSTGYAKIVELNFGGYAFLKDDIPYQSESLRYDSRANENIEKGYKLSIQNRTPFEYRDSAWLQTDADLPAWYDYRQQIEAELKDSLQQRAALNTVYSSLLPVEIQLPQAYQTWRFNIRSKNKDRILKSIFSAGLFASSHYASLAGIMAPGQSPLVDNLASEVINLFNDHHFNVKQAERVCAVVLENLN